MSTDIKDVNLKFSVNTDIKKVRFFSLSHFTLTTIVMVTK